MGAYQDAQRLADAALPHATGGARGQQLATRAGALAAVGDPGTVSAYREAIGEAEPADRPGLRVRLANYATLSGELGTAAAALEGLEPDGGPADGAVLVARALQSCVAGDLATAVTLEGFIAHLEGRWSDWLRRELRATSRRPDLTTLVFDAHLCVAEYLLHGPTPFEEVIDWLPSCARRPSGRACGGRSPSRRRSRERRSSCRAASTAPGARSPRASPCITPSARPPGRPTASSGRPA